MKKVLLGVFVLIFSTNLFAANMNSKMFNIFGSSINKTNHNLTQTYIGQSSGSKYKLRNSCGTMATLAAHNYFNLNDYGEVDEFAKDKSVIEGKIVDIFVNTYYREVGDIQSGSDIKNLVLNRWGWGTAKIRSTTYDYDYNTMIESDLKNGRIVIVLLKNGSALNDASIDHFIAISYASDSQVGYFDPWDGNMKVVTKQQFLDSWVATNYGVAIAP